MTGRSVELADSFARVLTTRPARGAVLALNAVVLAATAVLIATEHQGFTGSDGLIYMTAARALSGGESVYGFATSDTGFGFTYPPFAALAFNAFAWLPAAVPVLQAVCILSLYAIVFFTLKGLGTRPETAVWLGLCVSPLLLLWYPVQRSYGSGQVDLLLAALIVADALAPRSRWRGVAIGVAAAIKLTPAAFILLFLVRKDIPSALRLVASAAVMTGLGWIVAANDSMAYWTRLLWDTDRVGAQTAALNQSLSGLVSRVAASPSGHLEGAAWVVWLLACALAAALAVRAMHVLGVGPARRVGPLAVNALLVLLVSPISWLHHWVLAVVPVLLLVGRGWRTGRRGLIALAAAGGVILAVPPWWFLGSYLEHGGWSVAETLIGSLSVVWALAVLILLAWSRRPLEEVPS